LPGIPNPVFFALLVLGYRSCLHRRVILSHSRAPSTPPAGQTEKESEKAAQTKPDDFGENERDGLQFGSVIEDAYARILAAEKDDRFRVIELHQAGGVTVRKDPIYERLQNRSDFTVLINELSLYVLGRSLLMEDQVLFASAKRLYSTRNRIVHSGELPENDSNSTYSLDEGGAMASLRTAVSLFAWLGLRNDFPLPGMEFVPGPLS